VWKGGGVDEQRHYAIEVLRKVSIVHKKTTEHTHQHRKTRFGDYMWGGPLCHPTLRCPDCCQPAPHPRWVHQIMQEHHLHVQGLFWADSIVWQRILQRHFAYTEWWKSHATHS
jgi:hypothetical protein